MKTLIKKTSEEAFKEAGRILKAGGILAFPTDTVYGLGAVYTNDAAVKRIFAAKGRDEKKPLSILVSDPSQALLLSDEITPQAKKLMEAFWPGALTLILKKNSSVSDRISAERDTVGIRMPDSEAALKVIEAAGAPLAAPSANLSGKRSSVSFENVKEDLYGRIDMIIDGGDCPIGLSSTIADLSGKDLRLLREGSISRGDLERVLGREIPG